MASKRVLIPKFGIELGLTDEVVDPVVNTYTSGEVIASDLLPASEADFDDDGVELAAAGFGVERLLLALACNGVVVTGERFEGAISSAVDAIKLKYSPE